MKLLSSAVLFTAVFVAIRRIISLLVQRKNRKQ